MKANGVENRSALRGVGLVVLNPLGDLWIQRDLKSNPRTGRRKDDFSNIFETGKPNESHRDNVLGSLSELVNDSTMDQITDSLFSMDGLQSTPRLVFGNNGSTISYVTAVTVLDTPHFSPVPYDVEETEPVGWMSPSILLTYDNVRPLSRHAISYLSDNGIIDRTLASFYNPENPRELVIPSGHVISEYHRQREEVMDMIPGIAYPVVS